jgi:ferric-dicitrate binding protein FerR (iron transport regulator)
MESIKDKNILFEKFLENNCTQEEMHKLYELLASSDNEKYFKEILFKHLNDFNGVQETGISADFERIYSELNSEIKAREKSETENKLFQKRIKVKRILFESISVAAVFCIAFFLGTFTGRDQNIIGTQPSKSVSYNEIKTRLGSRSEVLLSDGTEVMLNAGSSIKYNSDYNSQNRDLVLEGEAYFKVVKNINLPLIVNAGNISIKATGTEFNVKAYSDEGIIETTLAKGEIEISQKGNNDKNRILVLTPSQKAIYASKTDQLTLDRIKEIEPLAVKPAKIITDRLLVSAKTDVEQVTAWTSNKLIVRSENLENLCTKLERKYDVAFIFSDEEVKKHRFSGVLLDETFQQVMDVIKLTAPVDYYLDGKNVLMFSSKKTTVKQQKNLNKIKN